MRRLIATILMVTGLVLGSTASAAPSKVVTVDYEGMHGFRFEHNFTFLASNIMAPIPEAVAPAKARAVSVTIVDENGTVIDGHIHVDKDGDGKEERYADICGETTDPIPVKPGAVVSVMLFTGSCNAGPSMPSAGTIEMTFTS
jgi:hypothetical protein